LRAWPGRAATGPELFSKRLALLKEIAPGISRAAFLAPRGVLEQDRGLARPEGVTLVPVQVDVEEQVQEAFTTVLRERADALMVAGSAVTYDNVSRMVGFASERKLPAMYPFREAVEAGGLMSYGTSIPHIFRQMARLADRVLKGTKPAELPAEQPTRFELLINLKAAKALGLPVPLIMQMTADEVVGADHPPACAFSRMAESDIAGVSASGSTFTCRIAGLPDLRAASKAGKKSAVFSTVAPKPPKARA
jgi:putative tryptophan/tyrosine transport system substrate-binding protein